MTDILVDEEDQHLLRDFNWITTGRGCLVNRTKLPDGSTKTVPLHTLIMKKHGRYMKGQVIRHRNLCQWDCRKSNLEMVRGSIYCRAQRR